MSAQVYAQTLATLVSFTGVGGAYPGASPQADLALSNSTLYGTTNLGGPNNVGTVFSVATNGSSFNSFNCGYGEWPAAGVTVGGSTLYGTTEGGGLYYQNGTVFSIATSGGSATTLYSFTNLGYGGPQIPKGDLTLIGSTLYGAAWYGGANHYDGAVFSIATSGGSPTTLGSFNGFNGGNPIGGLTLNGSTLYGTATGGGPTGDGAVFSIATSGGSPTALCTFNLSNGASPQGNLAWIGSTLYGTTYYGGNLSLSNSQGGGTVFSIATSGGSPKTLCSFNGANGQNPYAGLTLKGLTFYGTTEYGGANNCGTVFSIATSGGNPTVLYSFSGSDGEWPESGLTLDGWTLYGTTSSGGASGDGNVFALNIAPATIALSSGTNAMILRGGTATLGMAVSNSPSSGYNLNYTLSAAVQSGSATLGAITSGTGSLAPGGSQSCTVSATSTSLGVNAISFTSSDPNSSNLSQTATATLTVLDHAAAAFTNSGTVLNLNFGTLQLGSGTQDRQFQIENLPATYRATAPDWPWNR